MSKHAPVVRVVVIRAEGSTPRDAGAAMVVTALSQSGTIGGGALEFEAVKAARHLLDENATSDTAQSARWVREVREYPLGPALCQCCGGFAWVLFELFTPTEHHDLMKLVDGITKQAGFLTRQLRTGSPLFIYADRNATSALPSAVAEIARAGLSGAAPMEPHLVEGGPSAPAYFIEPIAPPSEVLYLYGAGHVGREIVSITADLGFAVRWVDTDASRFPDIIPSHARRVIAGDPVAVATAAEPNALHLVMTYSHTMDEHICRALLARGDFGFLGLIGSETKRARFVQRLRAAGVSDEQLKRLISPIGVEGLAGKAPKAIAVSVAVQLLVIVQARRHEAMLAAKAPMTLSLAKTKPPEQTQTPRTGVSVAS
jgi:xanthine dehydrogenase accessory factor